MRIEVSIGCDKQDEKLLNNPVAQDVFIKDIAEGVLGIIYSIKEGFISEKFFAGSRDGRNIYIQGFWIVDTENDKQMDDAIDEIVPDDISSLEEN